MRGVCKGCEGCVGGGEGCGVRGECVCEGCVCVCEGGVCMYMLMYIGYNSLIHTRDAHHEGMM